MSMFSQPMGQKMELEVDQSVVVTETSAWSELEYDVMNEIIEWTLTGNREFSSVREMIQTFWKERLE